MSISLAKRDNIALIFAVIPNINKDPLAHLEHKVHKREGS